MISKESRAKQVLVNTISGVGGFAANSVIGLALTPFFLYRLGFEAYGFWIVLSTAINYIGLMDLGIETTFIKYVAEYGATGQAQRMRQVVTFGVAFYCLLGVVFAPIAYAIAPVLTGWMKVSPKLAILAPQLFGAIALAFFLQSAAGVIGSLIGGIGYLRHVNAVNVLSRLCFAAAAVALLAYNFSVEGLVLATFVQIAVSAIAFYIVARRLTGGVFCDPRLLEFDVIKKLFKLGGWIQVTNFASTFTMETNRLIIAVFVQTSAVATYEIANKLTRTMRSVPFNFVVALLPAVSAMDALEGSESFNRVYVRAARYLNAATVYLVGFVMAAVDPICRLWLGHVYPAVSVAVLFLGFTFIIVNLTAIGTCMLRAIGQPRYEAYYFVCFAVATIGAMLAFVPSYGFNGVLAGMLAGAIVSTAYFLRLFHRLRGLAFMPAFFSWFLRIAGAGTAAIAGVYFLSNALHAGVFTTRAGAALEVVLLGTAYTAVYAVLLLALRFLEPADVETLSRLLPARARSSAARILSAGMRQLNRSSARLRA